MGPRGAWANCTVRGKQCLTVLEGPVSMDGVLYVVLIVYPTYSCSDIATTHQLPNTRECEREEFVCSDQCLCEFHM